MQAAALRHGERREQAAEAAKFAPARPDVAVAEGMTDRECDIFDNVYREYLKGRLDNLVRLPRSEVLPPQEPRYQTIVDSLREWWQAIDSLDQDLGAQPTRAAADYLAAQRARWHEARIAHLYAIADRAGRATYRPDTEPRPDWS